MAQQGKNNALNETETKRSEFDGVHEQGDEVVIAGMDPFNKGCKHATVRGTSEKGNILLALSNKDEISARRLPEFLKHDHQFH